MIYQSWNLSLGTTYVPTCTSVSVSSVMTPANGAFSGKSSAGGNRFMTYTPVIRISSKSRSVSWRVISSPVSRFDSHILAYEPSMSDLIPTCTILSSLMWYNSNHGKGGEVSGP